MGNVLPKHLAQVCCFPHRPGVPRCSIWYTTHPLPYALVRFSPEHCSCVNSCHVNIRPCACWRLPFGCRESGRGLSSRVDCRAYRPATLCLLTLALQARLPRSVQRTECCNSGRANYSRRMAHPCRCSTCEASRCYSQRVRGRVQTVRFLNDMMKVAAGGLTGGWSVLCWFASGAETA